MKEQQMGEVQPIRPKTLNKRYKNTSYVITFIPETKEWKWTVSFTQHTEYFEIAKSMSAAQKAAEKCIDRTLEIRGMK